MCEFCDNLALQKKCADNSQNKSMKVSYKVSLVVEKYNDAKTPIRSSTYTEQPGKLLFCPECGKRIEK